METQPQENSITTAVAIVVIILAIMAVVGGIANGCGDSRAGSVYVHEI